MRSSSGSRLRKAPPSSLISYLSGPVLPPSNAPIPVLTSTRRKQSTPRLLSPIRKQEPEEEQPETELEKKAREDKEARLAYLLKLFPFHYCVACHKCVSPIEQGAGRFCTMCDYGHILRLATFNDMRQSKVPEFTPLDGREVNEIPAFALLEQMPVRMAAAHQSIELVVAKMRSLRKLLEELIDLHGLTVRNTVGVDADTKALMHGLLDDYPTSPSLRKMWTVVNASVKSIDARFEEIGDGGIRPDLYPVCNPTCGLHGTRSSESQLFARGTTTGASPGLGMAPGGSTADFSFAASALSDA